MQYEKSTVWILCVFCIYYGFVFANGESKNGPSQAKDGVFVATNEWQPIAEGQAIPRGLHVRINMATGVKEAKLIDDEPTNGGLVQVPSDEAEVSGKDKAIDRSELKKVLEKIKDDAADAELTKKSNGAFRSIDEIKSFLDDAYGERIQTESEIVADLSATYATTTKDSHKVAILDDLEYYTHKYDNAIDLVNTGAFQSIIWPALNSSNSDLRSSAALLLGSACQNNPRVQRAAVELGALPVLIRLVSLDASVEVRARALYAVSAVVRHFPAAQKALIGHGGLAAFVDVFASDSAHLLKLQLKIATLVGDLVAEHHTVAFHSGETASGERLRQYETVDLERALAERGFCELVPRLLTRRPLNQEHDVTEKVLHAMLSLATSCRSQFRAAGHSLAVLVDKYDALSRDEMADDAEAGGEFYFAKLYALSRELAAALDLPRRRHEL